LVLAGSWVKAAVGCLGNGFAQAEAFLFMWANLFWLTVKKISAATKQVDSFIEKTQHKW